MGILEVTNLTHSFGQKALYNNATFELFKGEHMGIVGQNGTGKQPYYAYLLEILYNIQVIYDGKKILKLDIWINTQKLIGNLRYLNI